MFKLLLFSFFSQSSCFKAHYKRSNHPLFSFSTLYKSIYKQKNFFNGIAQSTVKFYQWDLLKVSALKHFTKEPTNSCFLKAPCAK